MFYNISNVIQWGSCNLEQNTIKSAINNATPQIHIFLPFNVGV